MYCPPPRAARCALRAGDHTVSPRRRAMRACTGPRCGYCAVTILRGAPSAAQSEPLQPHARRRQRGRARGGARHRIARSISGSALWAASTWLTQLEVRLRL